MQISDFTMEVPFLMYMKWARGELKVLLSLDFHIRKN